MNIILYQNQFYNIFLLRNWILLGFKPSDILNFAPIFHIMKYNQILPLLYLVLKIMSYCIT